MGRDKQSTSEQRTSAKQILQKLGYAPVLLQSLNDRQVAEINATSGDRSAMEKWLEDYRESQKASVED